MAHCQEAILNFPWRKAQTAFFLFSPKHNSHFNMKRKTFQTCHFNLPCKLAWWWLLPLNPQKKTASTLLASPLLPPLWSADKVMTWKSPQKSDTHDCDESFYPVSCLKATTWHHSTPPTQWTPVHTIILGWICIGRAVKRPVNFELITQFISSRKGFAHTQLTGDHDKPTSLHKAKVQHVAPFFSDVCPCWTQPDNVL